MKIQTTTIQDVTVVRAILKLCQEKARVAPFGIPIMLHDINNILDGKPLDLDSIEPEEKVRQSRFSKYCQAIVSIMLMMRLCSDYMDLVEQPHPFPPAEMRFIRKTRLGVMFGKLTLRLQCFLFYIIQLVFLLKITFIKYKWIITAISACAGAYTWLKSHDLSGYALVAAGIVGFVATTVISFFTISSSDDSDDFSIG